MPTDNILSIEQVAFNFLSKSKDNKAPFARNVQRLVGHLDCLEYLYRDSSTFVTVCLQYALCHFSHIVHCPSHHLQNWQHEYRLYTNEQQLYFVAYIVAVVAALKYIDIEFENQPVALPIFTGMLINANTSERDLADNFQYSIVPPDVDVSEFKSRTSKTMKLQKVYAPTLGAEAATGNSQKAIQGSHRKSEQEIYVQGNQFSNSFFLCGFLTIALNVVRFRDWEFLYFSREQAEFLRLVECIRLSLHSVIT